MHRPALLRSLTSHTSVPSGPRDQCRPDSCRRDTEFVRIRYLETAATRGRSRELPPENRAQREPAHLTDYVYRHPSCAHPVRERSLRGDGKRIGDRNPGAYPLQTARIDSIPITQPPVRRFSTRDFLVSDRGLENSSSSLTAAGRDHSPKILCFMQSFA
jgi:hypothetical protein